MERHTQNLNMSKFRSAGTKDTDLIIDRVGFKKLLLLREKDSYVKKKINDNEKLKMVLEALELSSVYHPQTDTYKYRYNEMVEGFLPGPTGELYGYTLFLFKNKDNLTAEKIIDFYHLSNRQKLNFQSAYDDDFYTQLLYGAIEDDNTEQYIFEALFGAAPVDMDWSILSYILERENEVWEINEILNVLMKILKAGISIKNNIIIFETLIFWNILKKEIQTDEIVLNKNDKLIINEINKLEKSWKEKLSKVSVL